MGKPSFPAPESMEDGDASPASAGRSLAQRDLDSGRDFQRSKSPKAFFPLSLDWSKMRSGQKDRPALTDSETRRRELLIELPEEGFRLQRELERDSFYLDEPARHALMQAFRLATAALQADRGGFDGVALGILEEGVALCKVLASIGIGRDTMIAALLHPCVEAGAIEEGELREAFGDYLGVLVAGSVHLAKIESLAGACLGDDGVRQGAPFGGEHAFAMVPTLGKVTGRTASSPGRTRVVDSFDEKHRQAENLQNLMLALAEDWHMIVLLVARNLVRLRGAEEDRGPLALAAARLSMHVYAPLARTMGIVPFHSELENRAFAILQPLEHQYITHELDQRRGELAAALRETKRAIRECVLEDGDAMNYVDRIYIRGRVKTPYSIYRKMRRKGAHIDGIFDLVALRVILSVPEENPDKASLETALCYSVRDGVHALWEYDEERVRDYIRAPKANGYQSLHTTCSMRNAGKSFPFEVQVRTLQMHDAAEYGIASHWWYKQRNHGSDDPQEVGKLGGALPSPKTLCNRNELLSWLQGLHRTLVYIVGPHGNVIGLRRGSTVQDAISGGLLGLNPDGWRRIHGPSTKVLVTVNGKAVQASSRNELHDGDVVELHTS